MCNPGRAGISGVFRNHLGDWLLGFNRNIGIASNILVEAWAIREGLQIAVRKNWSMLIIESDSTTMVDILNGKIVFPQSLLPLIYDWRFLMSILQAVEVKHTFREGNRTADALVKQEINQLQGEGLFCYDVPLN